MQYNKDYAILAMWPDHPWTRSLNKDKKSRDQAMYEAYLQYGYTLKDIAEYIAVHYTAVSRVIKKIEGEDEKWYYKTS